MDAAYSQASAWAQGQLAVGTDPEILVTALVNQGWSELQAREVLDAALTSAPPVLAAAPARPIMPYQAPAKRAFASTSTALSSHHARNMLIGGVICAIGIAITFGTYATASSSGGTYTVCWGAMIFGFIRFVRGFAGWMSGG